MTAVLAERGRSLVRLWPGCRDAVAVTFVVAVTWHLVARDGGRSVADAAPLLVLALAGMVACWPQLRRERPLTLALITAWCLSPVVAFAAASVRAGATRPMVVAALAVPVWLAVRRIWPRAWGPAALGLVIAAAAVRSTYVTGLAWFGGGGVSGNQWLALSWHNQAGALTGVFGVVGLSIALLSTGRVRVAAAVVAVLGLTGMWLSGSRGALIATVIAIFAALLASSRRANWQPTAVTLMAVLVLTGAVAMMLSPDGAPIAEREHSAAHNLTARIGHGEAAVRAAAQAPLTGHGPGSYRWVTPPVYPVDVNLTSSAHNEYLEVLSDRGVLGLVVWVIAAGVAIAAVRVLWVPRASRHRDAGEVAAAAAAVLLGLHAAVDFDWQYPVLLALLAMAAAVVQRHDAAGSAAGAAWPLRYSAGVTAVGLVVLAGALASPQARGEAEPWRLDPRIGHALQASLDGETDVAREELTMAGRWNPGAPSLAVIGAVVAARAGEIGPGDLAGAVDERASHRDRLVVIDQLLSDGAHDFAAAELDELRRSLEVRVRWGVGATAEAVAALQLEAHYLKGGCDAATRAWPDLAAWVTHVSGEPAGAVARFAVEVTDCVLPLAGVALSPSAVSRSGAWSVVHRP